MPPIVWTKEKAEQLNSCEDLLNSCDLIVNRQAETIQMLSEQNSAFRKSVEEGRIDLERNNLWYTSPVFVFGMGIIAGMFVQRVTAN